MPATYPRACPNCNVLIKYRGNYYRHVKRCGTKRFNVNCPICSTTFTRQDALKRHLNQSHSSQGVKRKHETDVETDMQIGGGVQDVKRKLEGNEQEKPNKVFKPDNGDANPDPLFIANVKKLGKARRWKKDTIVNQKFIMTLDQQRGAKEKENLNIGATHAIAVAIDKLVDENKIPEDYDMILQIGSRQHFKASGQQGESWKVPVGDFTKRAVYSQTLLNHVSRVLNSGEFITADVGFSASVTFMRPDLRGGKRSGYGPGQKLWEAIAKESKCVCEIKNKDQLCCARAIVVMREYAEREASEPNTFDTIRQDRGKNSQQLKQAKKLHEDADVEEGPCGVEELDKFQDFLGPQGYKLIVICAQRGGTLYTGEKFKNNTKIISLVKSNYVDDDGETKAHYDGLYSIKGFINKSYFCDRCCKGYDHEDYTHHNCTAQNCPSCLRTRTKKSLGCLEFTGWSKPTVYCSDCNRWFYGRNCFDAHLKKNQVKESVTMKKVRKELEEKLDEEFDTNKEEKSLCDMRKKCKQCHVSYTMKEGLPHKCFHVQCKNCLEFVNMYDHKCFITSEEDRQEKREEKQAKFKEICLKKLMATMGERQTTIEGRSEENDVQTEKNEEEETLLEEKERERVKDEMLEEETSLPEEKDDKKPEMVFADVECQLDETNTFIPILICYAREQEDKIYHHWGENCLQEFLNTLLEWGTNEKKPFHIFFHNMRGFDGVFIIKQLYDMNLKVEKVLSTGQKTLYFECGRLKFKDSLSFLNMPLSNFTKTFGLTEIKKGWFPHRFNKPENFDYEGPIPELEYYEPKHMTTAKKKECEEWHRDQVLKGESWNMKKEMLSYCESDVQLLKEGCMKFVEDFTNDAGFNPLTHCITIASACHYFWRNYQMEAKTIAVEPITGWGGLKTSQSKVALEWLYVQDQKLGGNRIKHARNGGEHVIWLREGKVKVDGYDPMTKTVYEFHGCEFHGCKHCKPSNRHVRTFHHPDRTVEETYQATLFKTKRLREAGYKVIEKWECVFEKEKKLKDIVNGMTWCDPLQPRDAFYGGRTGLTACYYEAKDDEEIKYVDVTSLYPTINKYGTYPIGHPTILINPRDQNIDHYFGIAKVDVLAPTHLFHPVLPMRLNDKLVFTLCKQCVEEQTETPWNERTCRCHHTDQERQFTGTWSTPELQKAVEKGYRILKIHEVWHFPSNQQRKGLFADYVNKWLKIKTEASGWPADCVTEEQKRQYIEEYYVREGIALDYDAIKKNPGRKQVSKLMLNSFWGKFGEGENKPSCQTIQRLSDWYNITKDETIVVKDVRIYNEENIEVTTIKKDGACQPKLNMNIFVAIFTTALARLKLYESLEKLGQQVLYYDTDSVIYSYKEGEVQIPTGNFLGEMTDELNGDVIQVFGSAGPKSYSYRTIWGKTECKNKGIKDTDAIKQILNCETMLTHVKAELLNPQETRRELEVEIKNHFVRDSTKKSIHLEDMTKTFGVTWDKRVVDRTSGKTYPFGYIRL